MQANASKSEGLAPNQGGKYVGFGSGGSLPPRPASAGGASMEQVTGILSSGWTQLSTVAGKPSFCRPLHPFLTHVHQLHLGFLDFSLICLQQFDLLLSDRVTYLMNPHYHLRRLFLHSTICCFEPVHFPRLLYALKLIAFYTDRCCYFHAGNHFHTWHAVRSTPRNDESYHQVKAVRKDYYRSAFCEPPIASQAFPQQKRHFDRRDPMECRIHDHASALQRASAARRDSGNGKEQRVWH